MLLDFYADYSYNVGKDIRGGFLDGRKNIKNFREQKGISQSELAEKLNVTRQAVSNWETGKTQPDIDTLHKIADILEVSIDELIYGNKRTNHVEHKHYHIQNITDNAGKGIGFGAVLAIVISYVKWRSIGWAILHGILNWGYVIYYIIKYGWS
jgi:transcriptional regulator with XRE-family HTH domain